MKAGVFLVSFLFAQLSLAHEVVLSYSKINFHSYRYDGLRYETTKLIQITTQDKVSGKINQYYTDKDQVISLAKKAIENPNCKLLNTEKAQGLEVLTQNSQDELHDLREIASHWIEVLSPCQMKPELESFLENTEFPLVLTDAELDCR